MKGPLPEARERVEHDYDVVYLDAPGPLTVTAPAIAYLLRIPTVARFVDVTRVTTSSSALACVRHFYGCVDAVWFGGREERDAAAAPISMPRIRVGKVRDVVPWGCRVSVSV